MSAGSPAATVTVTDLRAWKADGRRFVMLTAYDYTTARLLAAADVPVLLVGDSLAQVMLGHPDTMSVTMADMLLHVRSVARGAPGRLIVADMPFGSYHIDDATSIANAVSFLQAGAHAVKLEGGGRIAGLTRLLRERGIAVMGHLGLTPQHRNVLGGLRVQGRDAADAERIMREAGELEEAGAFAVVLEGMPRQLAARVTEALSIPTVGIGAGPDCDGQVLVIHDLLGLTTDPLAKFARGYAADLGAQTVAAARRFACDVHEGRYPDDEHSYH